MNRAAAENCLGINERPSLLRVLGAIVILAKPRIVAAVSLLGFTGMVLGGHGLPAVRPAISCLLSLIAMSAGSALVNSVLDRTTDRRMARLAERTSALDRVGIGLPLVCAATLTAAALVLALHQLNWTVAFLLSAASLCYAVCYTLLLKPYTHWAAVLGGIPGALPALIGSAAVGAATDGATLKLFLVLLIWQPPHFWLLSLSHADEYRAAQLPVLPLVKGEKATRRSIALFAAALLPATLLLWFSGPCSIDYGIFASALSCAFLISCCRHLDNAVNCRRVFRGSILYLLLLLTAIILDVAG